MDCKNCIHWIGDPVDYCELGPNQYPSCRAEYEARQEAEAELERLSRDEGYLEYYC